MAITRLTATHKPVLHIAETKNDGNPTVIGDSVDRAGWDQATFLVGVGQTDATVDAKVQEDDDPAFGSPADIAGAVISQVTAAGDNAEKVIEIDLSPAARKRYLRLLVTVGAGATGAALAVWCVLSKLNRSARDLAEADLEEDVIEA